MSLSCSGSMPKSQPCSKPMPMSQSGTKSIPQPNSILEPISQSIPESVSQSVPEQVPHSMPEFAPVPLFVPLPEPTLINVLASSPEPRGQGCPGGRVLTSAQGVVPFGMGVLSGNHSCYKCCVLIAICGVATCASGLMFMCCTEDFSSLVAGVQVCLVIK